VQSTGRVQRGAPGGKTRSRVLQQYSLDGAEETEELDTDDAKDDWEEIEDVEEIEERDEARAEELLAERLEEEEERRLDDDALAERLVDEEDDFAGCEDDDGSVADGWMTGSSGRFDLAEEDEEESSSCDLDDAADDEGLGCGLGLGCGPGCGLGGGPMMIGTGMQNGPMSEKLKMHFPPLADLQIVMFQLNGIEPQSVKPEEDDAADGLEAGPGAGRPPSALPPC
jgi:hypothetical protein